MSKRTGIPSAVVAGIAFVAMTLAAPAIARTSEPPAGQPKPAHEGGETFKEDMKDVGRSVNETATHIGHATAHGVRKAAKATAHGVEKAGHAVEHAAEKTEAKFSHSGSSAKGPRP